jgi:hypothetical protein
MNDFMSLKIRIFFSIKLKNIELFLEIINIFPKKNTQTQNIERKLPQEDHQR